MIVALVFTIVQKLNKRSKRDLTCKYPKAWAKKTKILPPEARRMLSPGEVVAALQSVLKAGHDGDRGKAALDLRSRLKKAIQPELTRRDSEKERSEEEADSNF